MVGSIRQCSPGSWRITIELERGPDGKRRQKSVTVRGTKKEADRELTRLVQEAQAGTYRTASKMTVAEYLEYWLKNYAETNVAEKTLEGYAETIHRYIVPALGTVRLDKLQPAHIQAYYTRALRSGRIKREGGLSARTVLHQHRLLRQALKHAVDWQFIGRNPADATKPPRPEEKDTAFLNPEQLVVLLDAAQATPLYIPILIACATGMRRGEVLGLRWQDVDLEHCALRICNSLVRLATCSVMKAPKTKGSKHDVTLPSGLVDALKIHKAQQDQVRADLRSAYKNHDLVVPQLDGRPRSPNGFTKAFVDLIEKLDLPRVTFHGLRHSHATMLLVERVPIKVVSERLGHSTTQITSDIYQHVLPSMEREAADRTQDALFGGRQRSADDAGS